MDRGAKAWDDSDAGDYRSPHFGPRCRHRSGFDPRTRQALRVSLPPTLQPPRRGSVACARRVDVDEIRVDRRRRGRQRPLTSTADGDVRQVVIAARCALHVLPPDGLIGFYVLSLDRFLIELFGGPLIGYRPK
jgi:hypothetical protein